MVKITTTKHFLVDFQQPKLSDIFQRIIADLKTVDGTKQYIDFLHQLYDALSNRLDGFKPYEVGIKQWVIEFDDLDDYKNNLTDILNIIESNGFWAGLYEQEFLTLLIRGKVA